LLRPLSNRKITFDERIVDFTPKRSTKKTSTFHNNAGPAKLIEAMTERGEETLILKRDPNARYTESYNVLF
jgi:hypothetical protein